MKWRNASILGLCIFSFCSLLSPQHPDAQQNSCGNSINIEPMSAGLSRVRIASACRASQRERLRYDTVELVRVFDKDGFLDIVFDCYAGDKLPMTVIFEDGSTSAVQLRTLDLDRVTKVSVTWKGSVNLDLHAFEYAADIAAEGHVWAEAPSSRWLVEEHMRRDKRGRGFLSFLSDGKAEGDQLEIYTFVHEAGQNGGAVKMAVDYESRVRLPQDSDTCGTGLYADIEYRIVVLNPNGRISRSRASFASMECNKVTDKLARYSHKSMPQLILSR